MKASENLKLEVESYFTGKVTKKQIEKAFTDGKFDNDLEAYQNVELYLSLNSKSSKLYELINKICPSNLPAQLLLSYKEYILLWKNAMNLDENGKAVNIRSYRDLPKCSYNENRIYKLTNDNFHLAIGTYHSIWAGGEEDSFDIPFSTKKGTYKSSHKVPLGKEITLNGVHNGIAECDLDKHCKGFFVPEKVFFENFEFVGISYLDKETFQYKIR